MRTPMLFSAVLLFSLATKTLPGAAQIAPDAVVDIDNNTVVSGTDYYILPVVRGRGGGVTLDSSRNLRCPLDVVQEQQEISKGLPLKLTPVIPTGRRAIRVNTDHNIKFSAASVCVQSTVWTLKAQDPRTNQSFITTGGVEGNPGRGTISNWFKIDKYENDYKIRFCPTVCDTCKVICRDVGIYIGGGRRKLALSDVPFKFMFKKA